MGDFPAHIRMDDSGTSVQTVAQHCFNTAEYAMENIAKMLEQGQKAIDVLLNKAGLITE